MRGGRLDHRTAAAAAASPEWIARRRRGGLSVVGPGDVLAGLAGQRPALHGVVPDGVSLARNHPETQMGFHVCPRLPGAVQCLRHLGGSGQSGVDRLDGSDCRRLPGVALHRAGLGDDGHVRPSGRRAVRPDGNAPDPRRPAHPPRLARRLVLLLGQRDAGASSAVHNDLLNPDPGHLSRDWARCLGPRALLEADRPHATDPHTHPLGGYLHLVRGHGDPSSGSFLGPDGPRVAIPHLPRYASK